ncbi:hypothetical protein [Dactylosporangium sp. NPDC051541]|uniref:hypothetical protein n=1 Tax=Dactylosporangium sp. NPDC051541 TaxID=3363977 RepID=UPI0037BA45D4
MTPNVNSGQDLDFPPYLAVLAVDAKGFTSEPSVQHQTISELIPALAEDVLIECGLQEAWKHPHFYGSTGDGFAVGLPTEILPTLVFPFLDLLQDRLAAHDRRRRHHEPRIRLRVSLNVGPLPTQAPDRYLAGNGTERNNTHRLLDSVPIKAVLASTSPDVTFVAAILSDRLFQDVVIGRYCGLHPDSFIPVSATVEGKTFGQQAWVYVPRLSGSLLAVGLPAAEGAAAIKRDTANAVIDDSAPAGIYAPSNTGQVAKNVRGGMHQQR